MFAQLHIIYAGSLKHDFQMNFLGSDLVDWDLNVEVRRFAQFRFCGQFNWLRFPLPKSCAPSARGYWVQTVLPLGRCVHSDEHKEDALSCCAWRSLTAIMEQNDTPMWATLQSNKGPARGSPQLSGDHDTEGSGKKAAQGRNNLSWEIEGRDLLTKWEQSLKVFQTGTDVSKGMWWDGTAEVPCVSTCI